MLRKYTIFWTVLGTLVLFSTALKSQQAVSSDSRQKKSPERQQKESYDPIKFFESEWGDRHRYLKWYSTGKNPANQFYAFRYDAEKPFGVSGIKMTYLKHDTAFYVFQDTTKLTQKETGMLQYFITPHDTTGKPGMSSEIALVAPKGKMWFTKTKADPLDKFKGIKIKWEFGDISHIKYFELYRSTDYYKDYQLVATVSKNDIEFSDTQISPDVVYYYRIMAVPADGNKSVTSNVIFGAGFNPNKPLPPYIKQVNAVKNGAVLYIQASDAETGGIRVYRDNGATPDLIAISDLIRVPDSLVVVFYDTASGVNGRSTYTYAAKTESTSYIESDFSEKVYVRPLLSKAPDAPSEISVYEEDGAVKLFWDDLRIKDNTVAGYIVKRREDSKENSFVTIRGEKLPYTLNYMTDSTVSPGNGYTYMINSVDVDGNISREGAITAISLQTEKPGAPFALRGYRTDEGIMLEWSQTIYPGIKSVNLYRYQRGLKPVLLATLPEQTTEYTDTNAPKGKAWFYFVTTTNDKGVESGASKEVGVE